VLTYGVWTLGGASALLCAIVLVRGRIRIERGWAGWTLRRFNRLERVCHWLLALSCLVLALTGLNAGYGRYVLLPLLGADTFAEIGWWAGWLHEKVAFAFMAALLMTFLLWVPLSLPGWRDIVWLAKGGGLLAGVHPPAWKFNTGQKLLFWLVMVGGLSLSLSGLALLPNATVTVASTFALANALGAHFGLTPALPTEPGLQQAVLYAALWHRAAALALLAAVIIHVYRRTLGIEGAFAAVPQAGAGALLLLTDPLVLERHRHDVVALALQSGLPAMYPWRMYVEAGGLMSYGISLQEWYRRAATYVDKILKGAKPGDLPVEQPMQFECSINLKTAQALGLTIPPTVLILADEVIR